MPRNFQKKDYEVIMTTLLQVQTLSTILFVRSLTDVFNEDALIEANIKEPDYIARPLLACKSGGKSKLRTKHEANKCK